MPRRPSDSKPPHASVYPGAVHSSLPLGSGKAADLLLSAEVGSVMKIRVQLVCLTAEEVWDPPEEQAGV